MEEEDEDFNLDDDNIVKSTQNCIKSLSAEEIMKIYEETEDGDETTEDKRDDEEDY